MADQKTAAAGQAELDARKADLDAREAAFAERERVAAHKESEAFCERLMCAGTLVPGLKSHAVTIMDHLAGGGGVVEFAEAGAENPVKKTVLDIFRDFLDHLPKAIEFAELAGAGVARSAQLGERAREYQASQAKEGRKVDIGQAVRHLAAT